MKIKTLRIIHTFDGVRLFESSPNRCEINGGEVGVAVTSTTTKGASHTRVFPWANVAMYEPAQEPEQDPPKGKGK